MQVNGDSGWATFYVDPEKGCDENAGSIDAPFQTIDRALAVVDARVQRGIRSDRIYLRGGVYRKTSMQTLYQLNLQGIPSRYAVLSAMPARPGAPGAVQRRSGRWYERVVFDDSEKIETPWRRLADRPEVWVTHPGFTHVDWDADPENRVEFFYGRPFVDREGRPLRKKMFTIAPYMLLQDGEPTIWEDSLDAIVQPGQRTYDMLTGELYLWPLNDADPNACLIETWYGGWEDEQKLLGHGEGRACFDGPMTYAAIRGIEFWMFTRLFEFKRRELASVSDRVVQRYVQFEDNQSSYGWIQILQDGNCVMNKDASKICTAYEDRSNWEARYNVFYRPSREVFQLHGDDHLFEHNEIIEHCGPWAGPAAVVSAVNTRNTRNATIRSNIIMGHGNGKWRRGSVFMIEADLPHRDEHGDYVYGGQTYENNLIANVDWGHAIVLGKGGARMRNITVRGNVFVNNRGLSTLAINSPHTNLRIESNIFYNQGNAIEVIYREGDDFVSYDTMPSSIVIRDNLFIRCQQTIDPQLFDAGAGSAIEVEANWFRDNGDGPVGERPVTASPMFADELLAAVSETHGNGADESSGDDGMAAFMSMDLGAASWRDLWRRPAAMFGPAELVARSIRAAAGNGSATPVSEASARSVEV